MADVKQILGPYLRSIRVPAAGDKVFKDECAFSFDNPVSFMQRLFFVDFGGTYLSWLGWILAVSRGTSC